MKLQWPLVGRSRLEETERARDIHLANAVRLDHERKTAVSSAMGETIAHARESQRLTEQLTQSATLVADKQREIAMLRSQLTEKEAALQAERQASAEERHKLMDWIAKGVSNGIPIFAEIPKPVAEPEEPKPAPGSERVPTEIEEAVNRVGRRARAIVKHIEKKNDLNFEEQMKGAGVRSVFQEDEAVATAEAVAISEQKKSA